MTDTHGAAITAFSRNPSSQVQIARGTSLEARSRVWMDARIAVHSDLAGIESAWRAFEPQAARTVFQQFDYLSAWFRHVGSRSRVTPAIAVIRTDNTIHAILPLAVERNRGFRKLTWLGQELCDYLCPLMSAEFAALEPDALRALWQEIVSLMQSHARFRHDWVEFRRMPAAVEGRHNPMLALPTVLHASSAYATTLSAPWDEFYRSRRTGKARKQDRSKLARLAEFGEVSLATPEEPAEIERMLQTLFEQKSEALDGKGITDLFAPPGHREFFLDLATSPRTRSFVHVSALQVGPSLAAINFGLEFRQRYALFLVSYDRSLARLSPGVIHLNKLIERAIGHGMTEFDFLVGEQRLKLEWTDRETRLHDHFAASSWRGYLPAMTASIGARMKRMIKQTPAFWSAFKTLRAQLGAVRQNLGV
ncbi:MAG TPA: GNAT family N-acetyltransferase [Xanthobacteraceae bacterium]|nr:GNAT family N-acetyltransferase [Xanthobacteraceae bacterium]